MSTKETPDELPIEDYLEQHRMEQLKVDMVSSGISIIKGDIHSGTCEFCKRNRDDLAVRRLNTKYEDESSNWLESCQECYQETVDYYNELWNEYRSSCLY